jgi:BolA protein
MNELTTLEKIYALLTEKLAPTFLEITDQSAAHAGHAGNTGGGHYTVTIASPLFTGESLLATHRQIYAALGSLIKNEIHALKIILK